MSKKPITLAQIAQRLYDIQSEMKREINSYTPAASVVATTRLSLKRLMLDVENARDADTSASTDIDEERDL